MPLTDTLRAIEASLMSVTAWLGVLDDERGLFSGAIEEANRQVRCRWREAGFRIRSDNSWIGTQHPAEWDEEWICWIQPEHSGLVDMFEKRVAEIVAKPGNVIADLQKLSSELSSYYAILLRNRNRSRQEMAESLGNLQLRIAAICQNVLSELQDSGSRSIAYKAAALGRQAAEVRTVLDQVKWSAIDVAMNVE